MPPETTTSRQLFGICWIPMVPDACLLPNNRRRSSHWGPQHEATQALRLAARHGDHRMDPHVPLPIAEPVSIDYTVWWPKGRRFCDVDALPTSCKAILDGLVDAGILRDDGPAFVAGVSARQLRVPDGQEAGVWVQLLGPKEVRDA